VGWSGFFEDIDCEDAVGLGRIQRFWRYSVKHTGIDVYHAARRHLESLFSEFTVCLIVKITGQHPIGRYVLIWGNSVAAGDNGKAFVATGEPIGVVQDLDVVFFPLLEIDRIFVKPVMVVLVKSDRP
jgi:hypothetical protein